MKNYWLNRSFQNEKIIVWKKYEDPNYRYVFLEKTHIFPNSVTGSYRLWWWPLNKKEKFQDDGNGLLTTKENKTIGVIDYEHGVIIPNNSETKGMVSYNYKTTKAT